MSDPEEDISMVAAFGLIVGSLILFVGLLDFIVSIVRGLGL